MRRAASPYLLLTLANLFWAGNWVVGRAFRDTVPPIALSWWRWLIALACVLPFAWPYLARDWPQLRRAWRWLAVFGILGTACYNALCYIGLASTTVINGLLLNSFIPIVIVLISWVFLGKRLARLEAVGVIVSLVGVMVIVAHGQISALLHLALNRGDLWILVTVFAWATYTLLLPHRPACHPMSFLTAIALIGLIALSPFYLWELARGAHIVMSAAAIAGIVYTGVFPAFLGFVCWNRAVSEVPPARAGLFMHLSPAFGIVLSILFLNEHPATFHFYGIALIFGGIWLNTRAAKFHAR